MAKNAPSPYPSPPMGERGHAHLSTPEPRWGEGIRVAVGPSTLQGAGKGTSGMGVAHGIASNAAFLSGVSSRPVQGCTQALG